jgi:hypothetical protein
VKRGSQQCQEPWACQGRMHQHAASLQQNTSQTISSSNWCQGSSNRWCQGRMRQHAASLQHNTPQAHKAQIVGSRNGCQGRTRQHEASLQQDTLQAHTTQTVSRKDWCQGRMRQRQASLQWDTQHRPLAVAAGTRAYGNTATTHGAQCGLHELRLTWHPHNHDGH